MLRRKYQAWRQVFIIEPLQGVTRDGRKHTAKPKASNIWPRKMQLFNIHLSINITTTPYQMLPR
jgi:hypothetical protein